MATIETPSPPRRRLRLQFGLRALAVVVLLACIVSAYLGYEYAQRMRAANAPIVVQKPEFVRSFVGHTDEVCAVAVSPDGRTIASGGMDGTVRLWDANTGKQLQRFRVNCDYVTGLDFSSDSRQLAAACAFWKGAADSVVIVWDVQSGSQRSSWTINDCVNCIKFSPDSDHVVYGTGFVLGKGEVVIRRLRTGRVVRRLVGHDAPVGAIAISPDGKRIASGDGCELDNQYDATIRIWEVATGREIRRFDAREAQIDAVEFSLDGRSLIAASSEHSISWPTGRIEAWEIASGKQNPLLDKNVCCIGLLRGGRHFVIGDPGALGIVDVESGKEIASIYPQSALRCLAVSPDSRFVVTGGGAWPDDGDKSKGRLHMWKIAK